MYGNDMHCLQGSHIASFSVGLCLMTPRLRS